jgi:hypothetical protein
MNFNEAPVDLEVVLFPEQRKAVMTDVAKRTDIVRESSNQKRWFIVDGYVPRGKF